MKQKGKENFLVLGIILAQSLTNLNELLILMK